LRVWDSNYRDTKFRKIKRSLLRFPGFVGKRGPHANMYATVAVTRNISPKRGSAGEAIIVFIEKTNFASSKSDKI